jgi:hypothetical protein
VLEFQHSFLNQDERESRERFYPKMVWVINGLRRKQDKARFFATLRGPLGVYSKLPMYSILRSESALLRDWGANRVPVYFDFGCDEANDTPQLNTGALWRLNPDASGGRASAYLSPVARAEFLSAHLDGLDFEEMFKQVIERDLSYYARLQVARSRTPGPYDRRPRFRYF